MSTCNNIFLKNPKGAVIDNYKKKPILSVVMSTYNRSAFIKNAIDSILNQSFDDFEFLIIDDASTDDTVKIIKEYNDTRIKLFVNKEHKGCTYNYCKLQNYSIGKYICHIDDDDISRITRLKEQFDFMEANLNIAIAGTLIETFGENKRKSWVLYTDYHKIKFSMFFFNPICHSSIIYRKDFVEKHSINYDIKKIYAQDYAFYKDVIFNGNGKVVCLPKVLVDYRMHKNRITDIEHCQILQIENAQNIKEEILSKILTPDEVLYFEQLVNGFPFNEYDAINVKKAIDLLSEKLSTQDPVYREVGEEMKRDIDNGVFVF